MNDNKKIPKFKYALERHGDSYAPMYGEYVGTMASFYDYKYLRLVEYGSDMIVIISQSPQFFFKETAIKICKIHQNNPHPECIELGESDGIKMDYFKKSSNPFL